jgi:hypothetical protein
VAQLKQRQDVMAEVKRCVADALYEETKHAKKRMRERGITRREICYALWYGWREKRKDRFDAGHEQWNYAIRGKTREERDLRIVVALEGFVLVITAIDLC